MRLKKAHVRKYRSIRDTDWFEIEPAKTILVGPNEAGKTALLQALQQVNPPEGIRKLDALRDYPRSEYNDITTKRVLPESVTIVEAYYSLEEADKQAIPIEFRDATYVVGRKLDNSAWHNFSGGPGRTTYGSIKKDLARLASHADSHLPQQEEGKPPIPLPSGELEMLIKDWKDDGLIKGDSATRVEAWLKKTLQFIDEKSKEEQERYDRLDAAVKLESKRDQALNTLDSREPVFVLFNNYFRVRPNIHLEHLAQRLESKVLDDKTYDYGNECLLRLLGFSARELSNLGKAAEPPRGDPAAFQTYRDQLDRRAYQLNSASVQLTNAINRVWVPDEKRDEANRLRVVADGQYLKVVVEDELGVEVELDQRSEGYQWLVSFFVVFFAESAGKHKNAILLLDEPGLSLHGLKQREFRTTISRLAEHNQTIYTTHSPFLVGPNELDLVRVVEMSDRNIGTKVHTSITASDPAALLPLQEALGYDLAQSLFAQHLNLVLEGLTDYWYVDAVAQLLREDGIVDLNQKIALQPAGDAGKVVYYATILHAQKLKVAALLDSDAAGDQAAKQDVLAHMLGNKRILRTKDAYNGPVNHPEIEDTLRDTLVNIGKNQLGWDVSVTASSQPARPIVDIFAAELNGFSKYKLAKAFLRWTRDHKAGELTDEERAQWKKLVEAINKALT